MRTDTRARPIALFVPTLAGGGAQRVVVTLANTLIDLVDCPVHVVVISGNGPFKTSLKPEVELIDLHASRTLFGIGRLASYIRQRRPSVVMSTLNYANVICAVAHMLAGSPCRLVLREASVFLPGRERASISIYERVLRRLMRWSYRRADALIANSFDTRESLLKAGILSHRPAVVIGNPVCIVEQDGAEHLLGEVTLPDRPYLCAIGRLAAVKGFDSLIAAFARMRDQSVDLVILGDGPLRTDLLQQAQRLGVQNRVHLLGFVNKPERVLRRAAAFVLSSRWEGFGNVLVEALGAGVPVVSTDCPGGPRSILADGEFGALVPVDDIDALAAALDEVLIAPRASRDGRQKRAADFHPKRIAEEYLRVLMPVVGRE